MHYASFFCFFFSSWRILVLTGKKLQKGCLKRWLLKNNNTMKYTKVYMPNKFELELLQKVGNFKKSLSPRTIFLFFLLKQCAPRKWEFWKRWQRRIDYALQTNKLELAWQVGNFYQGSLTFSMVFLFLWFFLSVCIVGLRFFFLSLYAMQKCKLRCK